jgi:hypothetical protein
MTTTTCQHVCEACGACFTAPHSVHACPDCGQSSAACERPGTEAEQEEQERYRKAHIAQLRAMQCPGCGETELF